MSRAQASSSRSSREDDSSQAFSGASNIDTRSQQRLLLKVVELWNKEREQDKLPHALGLLVLKSVKEQLTERSTNTPQAIVKLVEGESFKYDVCAPGLLDAIRNVKISDRICFRTGEKGLAVDKKDVRQAERQLHHTLTGSLPRDGERAIYAACMTDIDCLEKTTFTLLESDKSLFNIEFDQCEMIASCASDVLRPQYDFVTHGRMYACIHGSIVLLCWPSNEQNLDAIAPTYDSAEDDIDCVQLVSKLSSPYVAHLKRGQMVQLPRGTLLATISIKTSVTISWRAFEIDVDADDILQAFRQQAGMALHPSFRHDEQRLTCLSTLMGYEIGEQEACLDRLKDDPNFDGDIKKREAMILAMYGILHETFEGDVNE